MSVSRFTARLGVVAVGLAVLAQAPGAEAAVVEREQNLWPAVVRRFDDAGRVAQWTGAGPLLFGRVHDDGGTSGGIRPFWIQNRDAEGRLRAGYFLYPLFSYTADENTYKWSVFELIRRTDRRAVASAPASVFDGRGELEVWPFWFSRQTGDPELSYRGLFPIYGTIKNKLGFERATWRLFPLYFQTEKRGAVTTATPWPFVRVTRGTAQGFGLWPLYEKRERPGVWRQEYFLWPLGYNVIRYPAPDAPPGTEPTRDVGVLPFYARRTAPGYINESFGWPFFGYTDRTQPQRYHEVRYFWPLLVQGRGDNRYVNRWGPFYTHSVIKGYDKRWYLWPVVRQAEWTDEAVTRNRTQLLYFLYWSERQRRATHPSAATAQLTHVWPLYSAWNNGAGRKQFQLFSPFEVFFPGNEKVRAAWSPLVAIARHEQTSPGAAKTAFLWNAVTWQRNDAAKTREFHLGPLLSISGRDARKRITLGNGVLALDRSPESGWKIRWFDFPTKSVNAANQAR